MISLPLPTPFGEEPFVLLPEPAIHRVCGPLSLCRALELNAEGPRAANCEDQGLHWESGHPRSTERRSYLGSARMALGRIREVLSGEGRAPAHPDRQARLFA
jgi:hypothetical protein